MDHFQRRCWHPTPVLLPGKSHGQRSLVGCRLWGRTESDTTEVTQQQQQQQQVDHFSTKLNVANTEIEAGCRTSLPIHPFLLQEGLQPSMGKGVLAEVLKKATSRRVQFLCIQYHVLGDQFKSLLQTELRSTVGWNQVLESRRSGVLQ